jgi:hypothetical protein
LRPPLDLLRPLGTSGFQPFSPHSAPFGTVACLIVRTNLFALVLPAFSILGDGRHRRCTREEKGNDEFAHLDTPAETSPPTRRFSAPDDERMLNELRCFG